MREIAHLGAGICGNLLNTRPVFQSAGRPQRLIVRKNNVVPHEARAEGAYRSLSPSLRMIGSSPAHYFVVYELHSGLESRRSESDQSSYIGRMSNFDSGKLKIATEVLPWCSHIFTVANIL